MKKLLLGSVAMAGASALATGAFAQAIQSFDEDGTPVLTAGMSAQFEGGVVMIDDKLEEPSQRDGGFVNGRFGEIYFNGELTADNGLVYGARIHFATSDFHFQTDSGDYDWGANNAFPGREYMYFKGDWGSLELGNWPGPDSTLNFTPSPTTYKGIGGLDYAYKSYAVAPPGSINNANSPHWWDQGNTKVSYITPSVSGFQAGISYTPQDHGYWGIDKAPTDRAKTAFQDKIGLAARWSGDFGGTTLGISVVGGTSDDDTDDEGMVTGQGMGYYDVSGRVGFSGFVFAGSYWDYGDGGAPENVEQDYTGWALNASYTFGPYGVELQYAHAEKSQSGTAEMLTAKGESIFDGWTFALGYSVAPGLKWYGEVVGTTYELRGSVVAPDAAISASEEYDSTVFLSGLLLNF